MNYNVASYLQKIATEQPELVAVKVPVKKSNSLGQYHTLTFAQLNRNANCCAQGLRNAGVNPGTKVLMMVKPGMEMLAFAFAVFKAGCVPVFLDPGMNLKSMLSCIHKTQPECLIGIPQAHILSLIFKKKFFNIKYRLTAGRSFGWRGETYSSMIKKYDGNFQDYNAKKDDLAAILFTSGSTGPPKGVCYKHGQFHRQLDLLKEYFNIKPGGIDFPMLPVFTLFNPALGLQTVVPQMHPAKPASFDAKLIVTSIINENITQSFGSPVLWKKIVDYCEDEKFLLDKLKCILIAGAPVPPKLIQRLSKIAVNALIHTPYGATESLPVSCIESKEIIAETMTMTLEGKGMCVGQPLPGLQCKIIQECDDIILNIEGVVEYENYKVGEIIVCGDNVTESYDNDEQATRASKINDGNKIWHRIGDLGYQDDKGRLWYCGRKSHCVQTNIKKYYSVCCEAVFNEHPMVERSALIEVNKIGESEPAIVVESHNVTSENAIELHRELLTIAANFEHTKEISKFYCKENFPVDVRHNAKIHRIDLKNWAVSQNELEKW